MGDIIINKATEIKNLISSMQIEEPETLTGHDFMGGCYVRTFTSPANTVIVGKVHRHKTLNVLLQGSVTFIENDSEGVLREAPSVWESGAGVRKALLVHSDIIMLNIHPTNLTDLKELEEEFTIKE